MSDFNKNVSCAYCGLHRNFVQIHGFEVSKRSVFIIGKDFKIKYAWISEKRKIKASKELKFLFKNN